MKEIKGYILERKLMDVTLALHKIEGLSGMSVAKVEGFGRSRAMESFKGIDTDPADYTPYVKIEIVCLDPLVDEVVNTIEKKAYTGLRGDGKIYVLNVENAVRIETGERGEDAV